MKLKFSVGLIISIAIPLAVGALSALISRSAMNTYGLLEKPAFSPPAILFPVVWTILYILMGISSYYIYISDHPDKKQALFYYALQLFLNFFWSIIFFNLSAFLFAFFWLLGLIVVIGLMIWSFYRINDNAAILQIPYLLWCLFAAYLNWNVYLLN